MASSTLIPITPDTMIFDMPGRNGKSLANLFDDDLLSRIDKNMISDPFAVPFSSFIVLPAVFGNMKIEHYDWYGDGGVEVLIRLYDVNRAFIEDYTMIKTGFAEWLSLDISAHNNVRFIEFYADTYEKMSVGFFEWRVYGDQITTAPIIFRSETIIPRVDPGKYAHGICHLDNRLEQVDKAGNFLLPKQAKSFRVGYEGTRFNFYPDTFENLLVNSPLYLDRFGADHIKTRVINFANTHDLKAQVYHVGGSIKWYNEADLIGSNHTYLAELANNRKYIEPGADPLLIESWAGLAEMFYMLVAIYGTNEDADLTGKTIIGGDPTPGQGGIDCFEVGNEWTRDFAGPEPYHSPAVYYTALRAVWLRAKQADPNAKIYGAALTYMDISFWKALYFYHYWNHGLEPFPCDGFNMNLYMNTYLDGQGGSTSETALNPEAWGLYPRMTALKNMFDLMFPNKALRWTETGVATANDSPFDVNPIGGKTERQVQADVHLRNKAVAQTIRLVERIFTYALFDDSSYIFGTMSTSLDDFGEPFGSIVHPVGYALGNEISTEAEPGYNFYADLITGGGTSPGAWVSKIDHATDPNKKIFKIWKGSMDGSNVDTIVPVGAGAVSATLKSLSYTAYEPTSAPATIVGENVTVNATEAMKWLEVTYGETETPPNIIGGIPHIVICKVSVSFADAGITAENTAKIYLVDDVMESFVPGRAINGITSFVAGKGYYIVPLQDMQLSFFLLPPLN